MSDYCFKIVGCLDSLLVDVLVVGCWDCLTCGFSNFWCIEHLGILVSGHFAVCMFVSSVRLGSRAFVFVD